MLRIHRRLNSFIIIVIIFSLGLNWAFAGSYTAPSFDTEAEYAKSLIDGRTQPKIEDSAASADIGKFYSNDNKKGSKADLVDIREICRSEDTITYRAVKVSTKKVNVNSRSVKAPNVDLSGTLLYDFGPMTALSGSDEDTYCDVTYFTTLVYDRKASPDPAIDYCYRITSVKGGIISKSDPQISVTKLVLGYAEHGQY